VFAGPNGSGKSTVINFVRSLKVNGRAIDFGDFVNADEIAQQLISGKFDFNNFRLKVSNKDFRKTALNSGLINNEFTEAQFNSLSTYS
jgi:predicted ABC-type ATPase